MAFLLGEIKVLPLLTRSRSIRSSVGRLCHPLCGTPSEGGAPKGDAGIEIRSVSTELSTEPPESFGCGEVDSPTGDLGHGSDRGGWSATEGNAIL